MGGPKNHLSRSERRIQELENDLKAAHCIIGVLVVDHLEHDGFPANSFTLSVDDFKRKFTITHDVVGSTPKDADITYTVTEEIPNGRG